MHPARAYPRSGGREPRTYLTAREKDVLFFMANGHTNRQIGRALGLSEDTIKTRVGKVLRKLRVHDRAHAVAVALRMGLLDLEAVEVPPGANCGYLGSAPDLAETVTAGGEG